MNKESEIQNILDAVMFTDDYSQRIQAVLARGEIDRAYAMATNTSTSSEGVDLGENLGKQ